jgi:tripartite-type tricarboxylate transporter receptor subunit TctC
VPARSVKALIALCRARPGQLSYGSAGMGQQSHLTGELFKSVVGVDIMHVPYKGAAPAVTALISGETSMVFTTSIENLELAKTGRLRILAITSLKRSPVTPEVPTMDEAGLKDFEVFSWNGILAPAQTPREIIARLNRDIVKALQSPEVKERVVAQGKFVVGDTPEEFGAYIRAESARWSRIIKQLGIKSE